MAFVIVQHLDPTYKGMMVELLQRGTPMQVFQVRDQMWVEANCIYIIPPNKDMSILHGALHLLDPLTPRGTRLPIDFFFRSLAEDQQEHSLGVILSGMGSDGMLGSSAIKKMGGAVFVQDPGTAKFDSMPHSAIDAGLADVIAGVQELPARISAFIHHELLVTKPTLLDEEQARSHFEKVMVILRSKTGHDFLLYKKTTVYRRIERRINKLQLDDIADYVRFLRENPQEVETLFSEMLIGVTNFFRDPDAWEQLKAVALPALLAERASKGALRAWVPGCSTGEEAYSLAILFKEVLDSLKPHQLAKKFTLQIFATDLDQNSLKKAREGVYPASITADVSSERLKRFFVKTGNGYQVAKAIREMVIFAKQDIIMDPPFTRLDILSCRNLLIYMTPNLHNKLLPLLHYSLNTGGILFLGSSETIGKFNDLFKPLKSKMRLYQRLETGLSENPIEFPTLFSAARPGMAEDALKPALNIQSLADQLLLQTYSPTAVLTNSNGDILYISGHTGKYLEAASGKANWSIFVMAREGFRYELTAAFQKALQQQETVALNNIIVGTNGSTQIFNVTIQPIRKQNALGGMVMVVFTDVAAQSAPKKSDKPRRGTAQSARMDELEQELNRAHQERQIVGEEMQTLQKELESANEGLQSSNEELQSTNEELTTSKEEMQSMIEELRTVNTEIQIKMEEISLTISDMQNLLESTNIAVLFLDNDLRVRRFTSQTSKITQLIPSDMGRPITDIASALLYPKLVEDAQEVLRTLVKMDRQIANLDGEWFEVRILPYRTQDNMIDGVVITFMNITEIKRLEEGKEKLLVELTIANKELVFQNKEKEKRAAELVIANKELAFQNDEKEKRASELAIAKDNFEKLTSDDERLKEELRKAGK